jgi:hypothetical protein
MTFDDVCNAILEKTINFKAATTKDESEEDAMAAATNLTGGRLTPQDVTIAKTLAGGQARGGVLFNRNPQKQIEQAYGDIMTKLAKKLKATAASIQV